MGIIVEWGPQADPGTEYIDDIDLDNLENCPTRMQTNFWSSDGDGDEFSMWEVDVWVERPTDDHTVIVVKYRADIHRLYDAGMFIIHPETGEPVRINPELPETYTQLLEESEGLPPETLERVSAALWEVWPGD